MSDTCENGGVLSSLTCPSDVANLDTQALNMLAEELREQIIGTVSKNGGHLAPSLGVVELTLALLKVFNPGKDKMIWDVGHQAYAYKLLTGRRDDFHTLRQLGGVSGFPKRSESPYDHFGVGHSSTSISAALGMAMGRDLKGEDNEVIAVIGDGSMTAGLAFEGLNQAGHMDRKMVVVLNDNEMSISRNVGALSSFLSRKLSSRFVMRVKKEVEGFLKSVPAIGEDMALYARRSEHSLKSLFTPGMLFEAFRFNYLGPIDGHNMDALVNVFKQVRELNEPVLVHVLTRKGKGYEPAETNPTYFHGVGSFEPETGRSTKFKPSGESLKSYTDVFGEALTRLTEKDKSIVAITAAMPEGTGLSGFAEAHPDNFVDVGICEQHAVTFAAGLATEGFHPVVAIYSTFLQRAYDQVVHDVCLQDLPVTFCIDRAGLVGEDGPTHHGAFDISYLRHIPNIVIMAPKDEGELPRMMKTAVECGKPCAVRYPRGVGVGVEIPEDPEALTLGEGELLNEGDEALVIALGSRVHPALFAAHELEDEGRRIAVFNARFVKPLPQEQLRRLVGQHTRIVIAEENSKAGGFSSAVLEFLAEEGLMQGRIIRRIGLPDDGFVEHGPQNTIRVIAGVDKESIKRTISELLAAD